MQHRITSADIRNLIGGDEAAFRKIYYVHSEQVYQLAFRFLKSPVWSEEIVQDVFLKLWLNREGLDESGNTWFYLYVITKRLCLNRIREIRKSTLLFDELMHHLEQAHNRTEEEFFAADMDRQAQEIIATLPQQQRLVFNLSRMEGLSHKEIAKQLGVSPNTVKNHMVQALKTLKSALHQSGYTYLIGLLCCQQVTHWIYSFFFMPH